MSTSVWKLDKPSEELDGVPACTTCRKRKLRCSREGPPCSNCSRTGLECKYDSRQRPGLRIGAIEALNRRLSLLEGILLSADGKPRVTFSDGGQVILTRQSEDETSQTDNEVAVVFPHQLSSQTPDATIPDHCPTTHTVSQQFQLPDDTELDIATAISPIYRGLPSTDVLLRVVDFFCQSFHHWIPFLHKKRWRSKITKGELNDSETVIVHAAVAVTLPHLKPSPADYLMQSTRSKNIVIQAVLAQVTLETTQALIILVFDNLNRGRLRATYGLIGILVRAVDFLQLGVEPNASRSKVLMKPAANLSPAADWVELESRRRTFWCIFLLDRYLTATTGQNISIAAENVDRRLPADGFYFTEEQSVQCPFFGLWNKTYAKLNIALLSHVPAQYNDGDNQADHHVENTPSSIATNPSRLDSSKLGAFAYCIEATESLNHITTFFLQQSIDWQNKDEVIYWLTRFKELDLRLVHWKHFLPARWKDSNISTDKSLVDMDPNLTLAHMTHNTSMILLHYSIALPPDEWTSLIQLPSTCSMETCQLAATEISQIASKFLKHTRIPFVNAQFSFCLLVAAKVLLAIAQATDRIISAEFDNLTQSLTLISDRWIGSQVEEHTCNESGAEAEIDMARTYAVFLDKVREKSVEDHAFRFNFLDHSCTSLGHSPHTPLNNVAQAVQKMNSASHAQSMINTAGAQSGPNKRKRRNTLESSSDTRSITSPLTDDVSGRSSERCYPHNSGHETFATRDGSESNHQYTAQAAVPFSEWRIHANPSSSIFSTTQHTDTYGLLPDVHVPYTFNDLNNLSNTLMDSQYMELDRVITFEDANFYTMSCEDVWHA